MENTDQILDAPPVETMRLQYAGFWIRTGAYLLDSILMYVVGLIVVFGLSTVIGVAAASVINLVLGVLYFGMMEASEYQATLGKLAVGIKVGDQNGNQITFLNAMGRYFAKILSALFLCIGFMMVGWDEKNQGMHDKIADTYVFFRK